jgi:hypothetical protein
MSYADISAAIGRLRVGQHVHLDGLIDDAPPPGSQLWLPIIESVVAALEGRQGRWVVKLPLGFLAVLPTSQPTISAIFELLTTDEVLMEPPSVTRLGSAGVGSTWEGENHRWQSRSVGRSIAVISVSRSLQESRANEPFFCELLTEIG